MSYGYSVRLVRQNNEADTASCGVRLGRVCIERDIPVQAVAATLNVSRLTVYKWFSGMGLPRGLNRMRVQNYLDTLV